MEKRTAPADQGDQFVKESALSKQMCRHDAIPVKTADVLSRIYI